MSTIRLSNLLRQKIRMHLTKDKFKEEAEALKTEEHEIATEAYKQGLGEENIELIAKCPGSWFNYSDCLACSFGGQHTHLNFEFRANRKDLRVKRAFPMDRRTLFNFPAKHCLTTRYNRLTNKQGELEQKQADLNNQVSSVLHSATTVKKLCEVWPEITSIVEEIAQVPQTTALAIPMKKLNSLLGLKATK